MAPAGCCGSRRRASSRERSRRIGPGGGRRPAVNGPGRLLRGRAGVCSRAAVHARGLVPRLLCPVSCAPSPVPCLPSPAPRARVHVLRVPRSAFCVPRPTPASSVFRVPHPHPHPRPRCPALCARGPAPASPAPRARAPVFCVPRTVARVPRPVSPPRTSGQVLPASASRRDEKKIGRFPTGTSRFCMHCSGARLTRACG